jgi:uncharacterized protein
MRRTRVMEADRMTAGSTPDADEAARELMEAIDAEGCARLLAAVETGRLAFVAEGLPRIIVLNYLAQGHDLLFRTRQDAAIAELTADGTPVPAQFEVDSAFPSAESGWSVIATGTLVQETDPKQVAAALSKIRAWAQGDRETVLRLRVSELTGRRVGSL